MVDGWMNGWMDEGDQSCGSCNSCEGPLTTWGQVFGSIFTDLDPSGSDF